MSVIGTSTAMRRMILRSATRSGEPKRAHEKFFHGNRAPNTTDSGTRQVHLEEVNRALAREESGGLDNIYEIMSKSLCSRQSWTELDRAIEALGRSNLDIFVQINTNCSHLYSSLQMPPDVSHCPE